MHPTCGEVGRETVTDLGRCMGLHSVMAIGIVIGRTFLLYPFITIIGKFIMELVLGLDIAYSIVTHREFVSILMSLSCCPAPLCSCELVEVIVGEGLGRLLLAGDGWGG